ncbi:hypothetical protein CEXT_259831 [Caerostris extrusa]|uniref:Uncharacterized protein n=1 Tax=Caerostris extrusa TaxID=172846 RepID=A0AAV4SFA5_CAEEX|nr:hypothetical protein CEXT_259831 [Caerostris extrusa]
MKTFGCSAIALALSKLKPSEMGKKNSPRLHMLSARNNVLFNVLRPESYFYKIHATATVKWRWQKPWDFRMLTQTIQQKFVYVSLYIKVFWPLPELLAMEWRA